MYASQMQCFYKHKEGMKNDHIPPKEIMILAEGMYRSNVKEGQGYVR